MLRRWLAAAVLAALLGACGASSASRAPAPAPATFDIGAVRAYVHNECRDPFVVDADFCLQVRIDQLSADGDTLVVPTTLDATAGVRAHVICQMLVIAGLDTSTGQALGFKSIGILDRDGGRASACDVS